MKEIYLIRHAKSDWTHAHLDDFDRPLNERGLRDAPRIAKLVAAKWSAPEIILSSPAIRAYQTAQFFRQEWRTPWSAFSLKAPIYEATPEVLREVLGQTDPAINRIPHSLANSSFLSHLFSFIRDC